MKKILNVLGVTILTLFSFYYTKQVANLSKSKDVIMQDIMLYKSNYEKKSCDAKIDNDTITPGLNGIMVDVNKSYSKMKELGVYNENLYIFIKEMPKVTINNNYNYFIQNGNRNNRNMSLLFIMEDDSYLFDILKILKSNDAKATFFINDNISINSLKKITEDNHILGNMIISNNKINIKNTNSYIDRVSTNKNRYCYTNTFDYDMLNTCKSLNMYTIKSTNISNDPYIFVKENLKSGSIFDMKNNKKNVESLNIILKYIKQKGLNIVSLDELLNEDITY